MVKDYVSEIAKLFRGVCCVESKGLNSKFNSKRFVCGALAGIVFLGLGFSERVFSKGSLEGELNPIKSQVQVLNSGLNKKVIGVVKNDYLSKLPAYDLDAGEGLKFRVDYDKGKVYDFEGRQIDEVSDMYENVVGVVDAGVVCVNPNGLIIFLSDLEKYGFLKTADLSSEIDYFVGKNESTCMKLLNQ